MSEKAASVSLPPPNFWLLEAKYKEMRVVQDFCITVKQATPIRHNIMTNDR